MQHHCHFEYSTSFIAIMKLSIVALSSSTSPLCWRLLFHWLILYNFIWFSNFGGPYSYFFIQVHHHHCFLHFHFKALFIFCLQLVSSRIFFWVIQYVWCVTSFENNLFWATIWSNLIFFQQPSIYLKFVNFCNFCLSFVLEKPIHLFIFCLNCRNPWMRIGQSYVHDGIFINVSHYIQNLQFPFWNTFMAS